MNKYIVPICDGYKVFIKVISAKSHTACQEKIIEFLVDMYDIEDNTTNYREFVNFVDSEYDILIGEIKDIEEI